MDIKYINPFVEGFLNVMPVLGFQDVKRNSVRVREDNTIQYSGVALMLGIVGDIKGNVIYGLELDSAKKIASKMMMGMPVEELNDMAQSAISELSNMLTANASTNFEKMGININISTPTLMYGESFEAKMNTETVLCIEMMADGIPLEINVALQI
ncbi:chemotaxis protein CheX [Peptostreptococcaceae bacterium AGR-M142]